MTFPAENFQCFGVVFDTNGAATCRCPSDRCVASVDGLRLGRVSLISDINCRACKQMNLTPHYHFDYSAHPEPSNPTPMLNADDVHRMETFGPIATQEKDPTGRDAHAPGAKLDAGKCRPGLVLGDFARALWAVSMVGTYGAVKYTEHGWISVPNGPARYDDANMRHWLKEKMGEPADPDTDLDHAAHTAWNALARLDLLIRERESKA